MLVRVCISLATFECICSSSSPGQQSHLNLILCGICECSHTQSQHCVASHGLVSCLCKSGRFRSVRCRGCMWEFRVWPDAHHLEWLCHAFRLSVCLLPAFCILHSLVCICSSPLMHASRRRHWKIWRMVCPTRPQRSSCRIMLCSSQYHTQSLVWRQCNSLLHPCPASAFSQLSACFL